MSDGAPVLHAAPLDSNGTPATECGCCGRWVRVTVELPIREEPDDCEWYCVECLRAAVAIGEAAS